LIGIIDYGLGNITSVCGAIEKVGYKYKVCSTKEDLLQVEKIILPGVGSFGDGMKNLNERRLIPTLEYLVFEKKTPILGICLGSQLMTQSSDEFGLHQGLGWINARVTLIKKKVDINLPHIGWNDTKIVKDHFLLKDIKNDSLFYYVHSHKILSKDPSIILAECNYGESFISIFAKDNIFGTQFHPEKSQKSGLLLIKNFLDN